MVYPVIILLNSFHVGLLIGLSTIKYFPSLFKEDVVDFVGYLSKSNIYIVHSCKSLVSVSLTLKLLKT